MKNKKLPAVSSSLRTLVLRVALVNCLALVLSGLLTSVLQLIGHFLS